MEDEDLPGLDQARQRKTAGVAEHDVQRLLGDLDAAKIAAILDLQPDLSDLQEAAAWMAGEGDVPAMEGHPLAGKAAAIFDIVDPQDLEPS